MVVASAEQMQELGLKLGELLKVGDIVYLVGDLGAGKTTLVQGIAKGLGYTGRVTSPTFTIMNIYPSEPNLYHYDFYRIEAGELEDLGLGDYLGREAIAVIEWPSLENELLPPEALFINIELTDDDYDKARQVIFQAAGARYSFLLKELKARC